VDSPARGRPTKGSADCSISEVVLRRPAGDGGVTSARNRGTCPGRARYSELYAEYCGGQARPAAPAKKGALSIARRRRPSWQAEWAIRHGERTKVAIAEPSYATLACVGYRAKTGKHLLAVSWQFGPQHDRLGQQNDIFRPLENVARGTPSG
jgi:hypothetical protein